MIWASGTWDQTFCLISASIRALHPYFLTPFLPFVEHNQPSFPGGFLWGSSSHLLHSYSDIAMVKNNMYTMYTHTHMQTHTHTWSHQECCQERQSLNLLVAAGIIWVNSALAVSWSVRQFNCMRVLAMLTSSFNCLVYFNLFLNRLLGFCSEDQRCLPSAKPSHYHWSPPFLNLQYSHVCQESHWQERGQQWAHHHYRWSRYALGL